MLKTLVQPKCAGCLLFIFSIWKLLELSLKICFSAILCALLSGHDLGLSEEFVASQFIRVLHFQLQKVET